MRCSQLRNAAKKWQTVDSQCSKTHFVVSKEDVGTSGEEEKLIVGQSTTSGYQSFF